MIPKFRVFEKWDFDDPILGLMWYVTILRIESNEFEGTTKGGSSVWRKFKEQNILMQSTGLKDKNGVEIFDGDVVVVYDEDNEYEPDVAEVIHSQDKMAWMLRYISEDESYWMSTCTWDELEVIGNIYENPDLLEVPHDQ